MHTKSKIKELNNYSTSKINDIIPEMLVNQNSKLSSNVSKTFNIKREESSEEIKIINKNIGGFRYLDLSQIQNIMEGYTIKKLKEVSRVFIKQIPQISEIYGGEIENIYKVYNYHEYKGKKKPDKDQKLFKCFENSTKCQRQCCSAGCREFTLNINSYERIDSQIMLKYFTKILRPCTCNSICDRPKMILYYKGPGAKNTINGDFVSGIIHDYKCNQIKFTIYLNFPFQNLPDCFVSASKCENGVFLNTPCEICGKIIFQIYSFDHKEIGWISKLPHKNFTEMITASDNFICNFPKDLDWRIKISLISVCLFLDYRYFEEKDKSLIHHRN